MSLGQRRVWVPTVSGGSCVSRERYKVEQCKIPRYSRVLYHQKGTRTHLILKMTGRNGIEVCLVDRNNIVYRGSHYRDDCERGRMGYAERGMGDGCKKRLDGGARQGPT